MKNYSIAGGTFFKPFHSILHLFITGIMPTGICIKSYNTTTEWLNTTTKPYNTSTTPLNTTAKPYNTTTGTYHTTTKPLNTTTESYHTTTGLHGNWIQLINTNYNNYLIN